MKFPHAREHGQRVERRQAEHEREVAERATGEAFGGERAGDEQERHEPDAEARRPIEAMSGDEQRRQPEGDVMGLAAHGAEQQHQRQERAELDAPQRMHRLPRQRSRRSDRRLRSLDR